MADCVSTKYTDTNLGSGSSLYLNYNLLSCPKIKEIPMDPRVGGGTPFKYDGKELEPYDFIVINPIHIDLFTHKIKKYFRNEGIKGKELRDITNYYRQEYLNYIIEHETDHWKSMKYNPQDILNLVEEFGPYWRPIIEGITDERVIREAYKKGSGELRESFSAYPYERKLVRELSRGNKGVEKALKKDYNTSSCSPYDPKCTSYII